MFYGKLITMSWGKLPEIQAWSRSSQSLQESGLAAAHELLAGLQEYADSTARPLTDWDRWVLKHSPLDIVATVERYAEAHSEFETEAYAEQLHSGFVDTDRRAILLFRDWVESLKRSKASTVVVRPGLRLPEWIEDRYAAVHTSNLPWTISHVMQSAFMGAPELGEAEAWKSK
jgi:hypothetical protein